MFERIGIISVKAAMAVACVAFVQTAFSGECGFPGSLKNPIRILYLGDSLTDYDRGSNHVDQVQAKIESIAPRMVSFYNYSIRGDYITRLLDRLAQVKKT